MVFYIKLVFIVIGSIKGVFFQNSVTVTVSIDFIGVSCGYTMFFTL